MSTHHIKQNITHFIGGLCLFILTLCLPVQAKLPFSSYYGATDCLNPGYKQLSPTLGIIALDTGLIYNIRFYGDYQKAYTKNDDDAVVRDYIQDRSTDPIWTIVKILYPSNTGELGHEITNPGNFSQNIKSPKILALLLNFVTDLRKHGFQNVEIRAKELKNNIRSIIEQDYQDSLDNDPITQFEKDRSEIKQNRTNDLKAQEEKANNLKLLTKKNTAHLFKIKENPSDMAQIILNDIRETRNNTANNTQVKIDTILNNHNLSNQEKINSIISTLKSTLETTKYLEEKIKKNKDQEEASSIEKLINEALTRLRFEITQFEKSIQKQSRDATKKLREMEEKFKLPVSDEQVKRFQQDKAQKNDVFWKDVKNNKGDITKTSPLSQLISAILLSYQDEKRGHSLYPKYTIEQLLLAFFCSKFNTQEDIKELFHELSKLNPEIINVDMIDKMEPMKQEYLETIAQKQFYTLDDIYYLQNAKQWTSPFPYEEQGILLSNGSTYPYDRVNNKQLTNRTFQDCVEIGIRHFMNLALYDPINKVFDLSAIKNYVENNSPDNPYFDNFIKFYELQTPDKAENGHIKIRSAWNEVVGDLNANIAHSSQSPKINYLHDSGNVQFEVNTGFINFIHLCQKIFGLKFGHGDFNPNDNKQQQREWLEKSFTTLFNALTPEKSFRANFASLYHKNNDFYGPLKISVSSTNNKSPLFTFSLNSAENHSSVNALQQSNPSKLKFSLEESKCGIQDNTSEETVWLLSSKTRNRAHAVLYKLYSQMLSGNDAKINFLTELNKIEKAEIYPQLNQMLLNVGEDINLIDRYTFEIATPAIAGLIKDDLFKETMTQLLKKTILLNSFEFKNNDSIIVISTAIAYDNPSFLNVLYLTINSSEVINFYSSKPINLKPLAEALLRNNTLKTLQIMMSSPYRKENIDKEGEIALIASLGNLKTATNLYLLDGLFNSENIKYFMEAIKNNNTIVKMNLDKNNIGDEGAKYIADALKTNTSLIELSLTHNLIGNEGAKHIADALKTNTSLKELNLSHNGITDSGIMDLAESLQTNSNLTILRLNSIKTNFQSIKALAKALEKNTSLKVLDLTSAHINTQGAAALAEALKKNKTLDALILDYNKEIGKEGLIDLLKATAVNKTLKYLHMSHCDLSIPSDEIKSILGDYNLDLHIRRW